MISELKSVIKSYYDLERAWLSENKKSDEYLAAVCFFEHMTYRLTEADKKDRLIGLRMARRLMKRLFSTDSSVITWTKLPKWESTISLNVLQLDNT